jgi:hypothetical protein
MNARARALAVRLGRRDIDVLRSLNDLRLLTGAQVRRLHFEGSNAITQARKARAALQRLTELHAVIRLRRRVGGIRAGSEGHVYGLSGLGQAVLDLDRDGPRRHRRAPETKLAHQAHVLAVSELAVELTERDRTGACQIEEFQAEPACWRWFSGLGGGSRVLKPDAYVRLDVDEFELTAFIEQDMDTESLPTITRKLNVYVDYWRSGVEQRTRGVFPRVWWLVPDTARLRVIATAINHIPAEARDLFSVALTEQAAALLTELPSPEGGAR